MAKSDLGVQENEKVEVSSVSFLGYPAQECIMVRVLDNGFYPLIFKSDLVIVHRQNTVEDGDLTAVCIDESDEAVLRRVRMSDDGMILTADNESEINCKPIVLTASQWKHVRILGKVLSIVFRDLTGGEV